MQAMESANRTGGPGRIEIFEYPARADEPSWPAWGGWAEAEPGETSDKGREEKRVRAGGAAEAGQRAELDQQLSEEARQSFAGGRERGRLEGRQAEREGQVAVQAAAEERRMRQAAELIESFARERDRYLHAVEHEVVELALAVSARILRREAQMDPLLLTGAVRVALGQLSGSTQVRLRVPAAELELWTEAMALLPNLALKPAVVSGEGMRLGDCIIKTELGTVDLGIRAQLGEIERGFFDRAGGRGAQAATPPDEAAISVRETRP